MGNLINLGDIDVVILCGGLGTRLRPVTGDLPKVLVNICGRPFIDLLVEGLQQWGFKRFILCVGYMSELVIYHIRQKKDWQVEFSEEKVPLGTGGAIKKAIPLIGSETFLVVNGDTICDVDYSKFYEFHIHNNGILSIALTMTRNSGEYGSVSIDNENRIENFREKENKNGKCLVSAGIYMMNKAIVNWMPGNIKFSLEYDVFPNIQRDLCHGFITNSKLIDIGTPHRFENATKYILRKCLAGLL
ncbi:MAG: NTP transferase domain-containing protein [Nitrospirae bacterium]|nr:NTP transferase domain-containing protein [Nitrospirota bacterium]